MSPAGPQEAETLAAAVEVVSAEDGDLKGRAPGLEGVVTQRRMYPGHSLEGNVAKQIQSWGYGS